MPKYKIAPEKNTLSVFFPNIYGFPGQKIINEALKNRHRIFCYLQTEVCPKTTAHMANRIHLICFADDDIDDHFIFTSALNEAFPEIIINAFFHCDKLMDYLNDENSVLPDIIFLDYNMPGNDGYKCLRMIKATARILHIPVIIYSTSDYQKIIDESYKTGAIKYIVKPSSFAEVKDVLKEVIAGFPAAD